MTPEPPLPPRPARPPHHPLRVGHQVDDPWAWLINPDDPATLPHLEAENAWTETVTAPLAPLRDTVFEEIRRRTDETDLSVPVRDGSWWYLVRTEEGLAYPIHCRCPDDGTTEHWVEDPRWSRWCWTSTCWPRATTTWGWACST